MKIEGNQRRQTEIQEISRKHRNPEETKGAQRNIKMYRAWYVYNPESFRKGMAARLGLLSLRGSWCSIGAHLWHTLLLGKRYQKTNKKWKSTPRLNELSMIIYWFILIYIDLYWCILIYFDLYWFMLIYIDL